MSSLIKLETIADHVKVVTLHRPEARNALSSALVTELLEALQSIDSDPSIYCTIITGSGTKAFCAGADLKERKGMSDEEVVQSVENIGRVATAIENMRMPVIGLLNGAAFGGGLELALGCDIRLAASHAKIGLTETSLAIIPGAGGTQRLPRLIGSGKAKKMIFSAEPITAEESLGMGIVEDVVEADELMDAGVSLATTIAKNGPVALKQAKTAINHGMQMDMQHALMWEHQCYKETIPTQDRAEGLVAFREKRQPMYKGK